MSVLKVEHLTKSYGTQAANKDINIVIERGDIYGLIGKNGAGKTTLMNQLAGFIKSDSGTIEWNGGSVAPKMGICIDSNQLNKSLNACETLNYYGNSVTDIDNAAIEKILKKVGLDSEKTKKVAKYSMGMKQKLAIAVALLDNPEFLILDEPTNGLDPYAVKELRELIADLNDNYGITMIISSHNLGELTKVATRYGIMADGELVKEFDASEISYMSEDDKEIYILRAMERKV